MPTVYIVKQDNEYLTQGPDGDASWTPSVKNAGKCQSREEAEALADEHADPGHYEIIEMPQQP